MATAEEAMAGAGGDRRTLAALLFLAAGTNAMDVFSAVNSSPWTAEAFAGDPEKNASLRRYVNHGLLITAFYGTVSGILARSWAPIIGVAIADLYMWKLYDAAVARGEASGSGAWADSGGA